MGFAGEAAGEVAGVVFDAVAVADGLDHLEVEAGALVDALRFDEAAFLFELGFPLESISVRMDSVADFLRSGWTT